MTFFSSVPEANPVFEGVFEKYFHGSLDFRTIHLHMQTVSDDPKEAVGISVC